MAADLNKFLLELTLDETDPGWPIDDADICIGRCPDPDLAPTETVVILTTGSWAYFANHPAWQLPSPSLPADPSFEVKEVGEAGKGVVARRKIEFGELILSERPVLVSTSVLSVKRVFDEPLEGEIPSRRPDSKNEVETPVNMPIDDRGCIDQAISRLPDDKREAYQTLKNSKPSGCGIGLNEGIMRTNSMIIHLPGSKWPCGGVATTLSRINHSCIPNAACQWSYVTFCFELRAVRAIEEGEEITIAYTGSAAFEDRQADLLRKYGFRCRCSACVDPDVKAAYERSFTDSHAVYDKITRIGYAVHAEDPDASKLIRELRKFCRALLDSDTPENLKLLVLEQWLLLEAGLQRDPELCMELAAEGRALTRKVAPEQSRPWRVFDSLFKKGCSADAARVAATFQEWPL